jgi:hypothetical protein
MPVFRDTGTPAAYNFSFTRGDAWERVLPWAQNVANAYSTEVINGITYYTVLVAEDLTGRTFEAVIGLAGGATICPVTVTHNGTGGEMTITIDPDDSEATLSGSYAFELVEMTSDEPNTLFRGSVRVVEGVVAR